MRGGPHSGCERDDFRLLQETLKHIGHSADHPLDHLSLRPLFSRRRFRTPPRPRAGL